MLDFFKGILKGNPYIKKFYRMCRGGTFLGATLNKSINGVQNVLKIHGSVLFSNAKINIIGDRNLIIIEEACFFNTVKFKIKGNNNKITICKGVTFSRGGEIWVEDNNCEVFIGTNSTFEDVHLAITEDNSKLIIGENCMFAYGIDVRTGDSHSITDHDTNKRINYAKDIKIEDHVWVASHVSILKGSYISANSVVATRSVVTKVFDTKNVLIGGIPAKILKKNINWDRQRL